MSFAVRQFYEPHSSGGVVVPGAYSSGSFTLQSDGVALGSSYSGPSAWFTPTQSGIGSSYWVRCTKTAGSRNVTNSGLWVSLATDQTFNTTGGPGNCTGTIEWSTDSGGSVIVASGTFSVNNTL